MIPAQWDEYDIRNKILLDCNFNLQFDWLDAAVALGQLAVGTLSVPTGIISKFQFCIFVHWLHYSECSEIPN